MELRILVIAASLPAMGVVGYGQTAIEDMMPSSERVTYFSGAVTLEDGSAPPDAVRLQRVCDGQSHDEGWTDTKGRFSFKVGRNDSGTGMGDATEAADKSGDLQRPIGFSTQVSSPVTSELKDCELEVVLAGYRADRVSLKVASVGATNLGTMVLHPISKVGALTVSATTLQAPANARKAYEKGLELLRAKKWDAAAAELGKAVQIFPKFATAWYQLGEARLNRSDIAGAAEAWRQSVTADPKYVNPWERLTVLADQKQDWVESAKASDAWLQLDAEDFPGAWLYNAIAKARLGDADQAEHSAREGLRVDKEQRVPRLNYVLGLILMQKQQYVESAECFRTYLKLAPNARDAEVVRQQLAEFDRMATTGPKHTP
jgi:Tfp pilus assembly protein PilF